MFERIFGRRRSPGTGSPASTPEDAMEAATESLRRGDVEGAAHVLERAIRSPDAAAKVFHRLGRLLRSTGQQDRAVACYRKCLERHPDDSISQVGLASLGELPAPPRLPDEIVLHVFDTNASGYEENMRSLGYSIPALLFESFETHFPGSREGLQILDLGCGTGWCGEVFSNVARRIVGVDLSPRMLAIAGSKGVYDQLVEAELGTWLAETTDEFDLVIAANTLIYFGELPGIVTAAARTLRPGGALLFDVERALDSPHVFHSGGRYAHSRGHVLESFEAAALDVLALEEVVMRTQGEEEVDALLCVAARGSAA